MPEYNTMETARNGLIDLHIQRPFVIISSRSLLLGIHINETKFNRKIKLLNLLLSPVCSAAHRIIDGVVGLERHD